MWKNKQGVGLYTVKNKDTWLSVNENNEGKRITQMSDQTVFFCLGLQNIDVIELANYFTDFVGVCISKIPLVSLVQRFFFTGR